MADNNVQIILEAIDKASNTFSEISSKINLMSQSLQKAKEFYDFGKEGAQIEFIQIKFDRLAKSVGTTGDILLSGMKEATKGTLSDMEAMASATDLLSLGLAKTGDEAIRLATVQAGLGMDMNQLVLTLSNQTTMRFDQLGVSVDGFKERVQGLKDAGMDANEAFKEAFLQQAEAQLERVGNAADTAAGSFMKYEAVLKNYSDTMKTNVGSAMGPILKMFTDFSEARKEDIGIFEAYKISIGGLFGAEEETTEAVEENADAFGMQKEAMQAALEVMEPTVEQLKAQEEAIKEMTKANMDYLGTIEKISDEYDVYMEKLAEVAADESLSFEERQAKMDEFTASYEENANRRILKGVEEQLAKEGLTEAETLYLEQLGLAMGVYTEEAIAQMDAERAKINELVSDFNNIPTEKTVTITVQQIGGYEIGTAQYNRIAYAGRQHGGEVAFGSSYWVGEAGIPELFTPKTGGTITPASQVSSGINEDRLARKIVEAMMRGMQQ